ncbi:MAG: hypothetical protein H6617_03260 [Bdellovibrionaceae bacterium]|nr:hypothetical protein [Bdellovibrionales bacterium]MCB9253678.1 hypothetical protein [Pseudobdellovibrionaceae bacterium]
MNTTLKFRFLQGMTLIGALFLLSGCFAKSCQKLPDQRFQSITETEWRLVYSTDPSTASQLNNFNFTILTFTDSFDIQMTSVKNNQQAGTPEVVGDYTVQNGEFIVAKLQSFDGSDLGTMTWSFTLSRILTLIDTSTGFTFIFYPFEGIVKPDFQCEFKF